jgi:hypothetical protein
MIEYTVGFLLRNPHVTNGMQKNKRPNRSVPGPTCLKTCRLIRAVEICTASRLVVTDDNAIGPWTYSGHLVHVLTRTSPLILGEWSPTLPQSDKSESRVIQA